MENTTSDSRINFKIWKISTGARFRQPGWADLVKNTPVGIKHEGIVQDFELLGRDFQGYRDY